MVLLAIWSPCLGKRELSLCLSHICLLARHTLICVTFSLPPDVGIGCGFCLWLFLDFSVYLFEWDRSCLEESLSTLLGLPSTASRETLDVAAGVLPLDLLFCEYAFSCAANIIAKPTENHLKQTLNDELQAGNNSQQRFVTPLGLAVCQVTVMKNRRIQD